MDLFESVFLKEISSPIMFRVAYNLTQNKFAAEDLLQETAYQAWRSRHTFQLGSNMGAWLNRICHNSFCNQLVKPENRVKVRYVEFPETHNSEVVYNDATEFEERQVAEMKRRKMYAGIDMLPEKIRETILLKLDGKKNREIAASLNIAKGTVGSQASRGNDYLTQIMKTGRINWKDEQPVEQYTKEGVFVKRYHSATEAALATKTNAGNISSVVAGTGTSGAGCIRKYAGGFIWKKASNL